MFKVGQKVFYRFEGGNFLGEVLGKPRVGVIVDIDKTYIYARFPDTSGRADRTVRFDLDGNGIGWDLDTTDFGGSDGGSKLIPVDPEQQAEPDPVSLANTLREAYATVIECKKALESQGYGVQMNIQYPGEGVKISKVVQL